MGHRVWVGGEGFLEVETPALSARLVEEEGEGEVGCVCWSCRAWINRIPSLRPTSTPC